MGVQCPDGEHHVPHNLPLLLSSIYPVEMGVQCPDREHHVSHNLPLYSVVYTLWKWVFNVLMGSTMCPNTYPYTQQYIPCGYGCSMS